MRGFSVLIQWFIPSGGGSALLEKSINVQKVASIQNTAYVRFEYDWMSLNNPQCNGVKTELIVGIFRSYLLQSWTTEKSKSSFKASLSSQSHSLHLQKWRSGRQKFPIDIKLEFCHLWKIWVLYHLIIWVKGRDILTCGAYRYYLSLLTHAGLFVYNQQILYYSCGDGEF